MSAGDKRDLGRGWERAEALFEEEADRIAKMSDADFDRAMEAMPEPERVPGVEEVMARAAGAGAGVVARAGAGAVRGRGRWVTLAAVAAGVLAIAAVAERRAIVAWFGGKEEPIQPDRWAPPKEPTPRERAEKLRDEAAQACADHLWGRCASRLDEAKALDPAGEGEPKAQGMRAAIREATTPRPGPPEKP
jgi:hypothetical protein